MQVDRAAGKVTQRLEFQQWQLFSGPAESNLDTFEHSYPTVTVVGGLLGDQRPCSRVCLQSSAGQLHNMNEPMPDAAADRTAGEASSSGAAGTPSSTGAKPIVVLVIGKLRSKLLQLLSYN